MKKNILYLSPSNRWLGARISLHVLLKMLDKDRFNPIIVCPSKEGPFAEVLEQDGFHVEYLRLWNWRKYKYVIHRLVSCWRLRKLIQREKIDLIHCNEFWTAPYAYWASWGMNIPLISHVRLNMTQKKIRDYYLGKMSRIICVCKDLVEKFSAWQDYKSRVKPIYNGVDLDEYNPEKIPDEIIRAQFNIPSDALVIGLVGQISERKGQDRLIRIAPHIIEKFPHVKFMLVGSSREHDYENKIHSMIDELNLRNYFILTGDMTDMPHVYKALDILVLPSMMEGFGRVVVEAEAMQIPVVVSAAGGLVEVVDPGKTGYIFSLDNDQEMIDCLLQLCANPSIRQQMGRAGREFVTDMFSKESMVKKTTALYMEVLK
ncbi:MAG TPA: glycosyltransferase family 4 protein [Candidatus Sumerlaeota bacterium]|nr:MAG: Spore coat protein SA [candidate division BRC1 bacterium ADurb.Bin183]HOE63541.1 glycosyltransferase family 4 protein [Candidatus Sumerlaeota bacterium]HRR30558.1 glycosyltransferase family 4 protein [Candidatus Sumerlaeia bacterium]HON51343.1 glycosyltransferase family 4 protein [Candidatus Sumerlaeota bacterium]HOR64603.1 glycosyltransferase family 4 protein [Candidatus Sumerlaeota bacterium]